jgi:hypothetical protein
MDYEGRIIEGKMICLDCPSVLIVFAPPKGDPIRTAVVIVRPLAHNHPAYTPEKMTLEAKADLIPSINNAGLAGLSVEGYRNGM